MEKSLLKKIFVIVLAVCMISSLLIMTVGCKDDKDETPAVPEKKAIIILPGIMGSNIIEADTGEPLWAPLDKGLKMFDLEFPKDLGMILRQDRIMKLIDFEGEGGLYEWLDKMTVNPDGTSKHSNSAQVIDDDGNVLYPKASTYGTLEYYEKTYNFLYDNFGSEYDVRMFEYDWRLDNMTSAIALEKFINDHGYTKVTFVAHSMGGVLASTYLARSEENRNKTDKFISLGTPFFGAHKAIRVPENPLSLVGDSADMQGMIDTLNNFFDVDLAVEKLLEFVVNLPTIYQLIPYADMCGAYTADNEELKDLGIVNVDGTSLKTYDEVLAFLKARGFSNDDFVDKMVGWQNEQYVANADGTLVHASKLVDTRYFVGNDKPTELCVNYVNGEMVNCTMSNQGDGTVPLYSALCGLPLNDSRVYEFKGISHGDLSYEDACLNKVAEVIRG